MGQSRLRIIKGGSAIAILVPILSLLVGLSAALAAREQNRRMVFSWREPYLMGVVLFVGLVLLPVAAYLFLQYPAWYMLYLVLPEQLTTWFMLAIFAASLFVAVGGFFLGYTLCRRRLDKVVVALLAVCTLGLVALFFLAGNRLGRLSETLNLDNAPPVLSTRLGAVFAFALPEVLGGWIFLLVFFDVEGRKMRRATIPESKAAGLKGLNGSATSASPRPQGSFERASGPQRSTGPQRVASVTGSEPSLRSAGGSGSLDSTGGAALGPDGQRGTGAIVKD